MFGRSRAARNAGRRVADTDNEHENRSAKFLQRQLLSHRREKLRLRAEEVFADMSVPVGSHFHGEDCLLEDDIYDFLEEVLEMDAEKLQPEAVTLLVSTAYRVQAKENMLADVSLEEQEEGLLCREALLPALVKYGEFIKRFDEKGQEDMFKKYDRGSDGNLSRKELRLMLQDYERKATRSKHGFVVTFMIYDSDLDWIIAQVDEDGNGEIDRAEFLPAIAAWEELAEARLQTPTSCVIL